MRKRTPLLSTALALALAATSPAMADALPCEARYTDGVSLFQAGDYAGAEMALLDAISLSPEPDTEDGGYTPYIYLAATRWEMGDVEGARAALIQSQVYGASGKTRAGQNLIEEYAVSIMSAAPPAGDPTVPKSSPVVSRNVALSEQDAEIIRARVLRRCALSTDVSANKLPWYFHYLLGLEYTEEGDSERALEAFQIGANLKDQPSRSKRLYGMWFMDYLPYYQIALAHEEMGEWQDAKDALYVSLQAGEFEEGKRGWQEFVEMENRLDRQISGPGGS